MTSLAVLEHMRQAGGDAVIDSGEIHRDGVIPFLVLGLTCLAQRLDARIVDHEMQFAVLGFYLVEQVFPAIALGDVVFDREHSRVARLEQGQRGLEAFFIAIADHDNHAGVRGGTCNAESDSVGGGRDVRHLTLEVLQRGRL